MNENGTQIKKKILLVDDNQILREIYEAVLREEGFEVVSAKDGQEAWELMDKGLIPDILFTGILMPRMDGFMLIEKMRQDPRVCLVPVTVSSHRGLAEHQERAKALGVKDFIFQGTTPPPQVVKRIKMVLGIKSNFRIALASDEQDGRALISYLNKMQGTSCNPLKGRNAILEFESGPERNDFTITLKCGEDDE